jgi:hypothetical protein
MRITIIAANFDEVKEESAPSEPVKEKAPAVEKKEEKNDFFDGLF